MVLLLIMVTMVALLVLIVESSRQQTKQSITSISRVQVITSLLMMPCLSRYHQTISYQGPVIVLMHQYALVEDGISSHSSPQIEWNQVSVDDWS